MFSFTKEFQEQIIALARHIAKLQQGEDHLPDIETLLQQFQQEQNDFEESEYPSEKIMDIVYSALCLAAQGRHEELQQISRELPVYHYSQAQIEQATLAKYTLRAAGKSDEDAERKAIMAALEQGGAILLPKKSERSKALPEEQWQLTTTPCHKAKCRNCGWEASADGTTDQAIAWFRTRGWQLKSNGPWCPECVLEDEMSRDDLGVRPK